MTTSTAWKRGARIFALSRWPLALTSDRPFRDNPDLDVWFSLHPLPEARMSTKAPWITYRPEIRVLDCTIRDGGLINEHNFTDTLVKAVYTACVEAGIDYMEVGYRASRKLFA